MSMVLRPKDLQSAVSLLADHAGVRVLAGCTDVMVAEAAAEREGPGYLDLGEIEEIQGIEERDGGIRIGAATPFGRIRGSKSVGERYPILAEAASVIGGWQIQNRATLGGNIVNASPAGDSLPVLLALDARVVVVGPSGQREISYDEFHIAYRATALEEGELLAWIDLPAPSSHSVQRFRKVGTRAAQAISKVVLATVFDLDDRRLSNVRVAAGSVAPTPLRLLAVESLCEGARLDAELAERAAEAAMAEVHPIDDVRSTADYRRHVLARLVRRALLEALDGGD